MDLTIAIELAHESWPIYEMNELRDAIEQNQLYDAYLLVEQACLEESEKGDCPAWRAVSRLLECAGDRSGYEVCVTKNGSRGGHYVYFEDNPFCFFDEFIEKTDDIELSRLNEWDYLAERYDQVHCTQVVCYDRSDDSDWTLLPITVRLRQNNDVL